MHSRDHHSGVPEKSYGQNNWKLEDCSDRTTSRPLRTWQRDTDGTLESSPIYFVGRLDNSCLGSDRVLVYAGPYRRGFNGMAQ
jgi:hypothetical protein